MRVCFGINRKRIKLIKTMRQYILQENVLSDNVDQLSDVNIETKNKIKRLAELWKVKPFMVEELVESEIKNFPSLTPHDQILEKSRLLNKWCNEELKPLNN